MIGFIVSNTDCLKFPPGALLMISSADEDSSDSLSDPVAKKRDMAEGRCQSVRRKIHHVRNSIKDNTAVLHNML